MEIVKFEDEEQKEFEKLKPEILDALKSDKKIVFACYDKEAYDWKIYYHRIQPEDLCFVGAVISRFGLKEKEDEKNDKFKRRHTICEKSEHENIDVICGFPGMPYWRERVCKKCLLDERHQADDELIKKLKEGEMRFFVGGALSDGSKS